MLEPWDGHNQRLAARVAPRDWVNPLAMKRYDLLVIGAGPAGLVCAAGAAGLGAKVALVEKHLLGGDCLNVGCVPSKALIASAREAARARRAMDYGVQTGLVSVDFPAVLERMRRIRADIAVHDSAERFTKLGIDVFMGSGQFTASDAFTVDGQELRFSRACIATGARAARPEIPGLESIPTYSNESIFSLTELPRRLAVVGAGPIGCEMAQAFARFGSEVTMVHADERILPRDEPEAAAIVHDSLLRDGIIIHGGARNLRVAEGRLSWDGGGAVSVDALLLAAGRRPNVEDLGLETAGVTCTAKGIKVDDQLRSTNPNIFAAGDVASRFQFTHAADFLARVVIQNALFLGRAKASALTIPWCTYTDPELEDVGQSTRELKESGVSFDTHTIAMDQVDRAVVDGDTEGYLSVHVDRRGKILGATAVCRHAGELIGEVSLAMTQGIGMSKVARSIHPYPTYGEAFRRLGDSYNRGRLTPTTRALLELLLRRFGN